MGVLHLMVQALVNLTPALFVNIVAHLVVPDIMVRLYREDATIIVELQRLPQGAAILHLIVPRHMVEPQQQILRTRIDIIINTREFLAILADGIRSLRRTLETHALLVGLMVINGAPLQRLALDETVGLRTVVVVELKDVM